jgi:ribonuclease D
MAFVHLQDASQTDALRRDLASSRRIALDCEAAGFHRYSDRLCLLQVTTESETYVVDSLAFDPSGLLRAVLEDPAIPVIMHGADYDLRLLDRDLGIRLRGLFDTQVAAALLGEQALGLQALLESRLGISLSKKYQRADWAERPLSEGMLEYAADDTRHLLRLADLLAAELSAAGRSAWAEEECRTLEANATAKTVDDAEPEDPVTRVKGARDLTPREVTALREALEWRDRLARERDKAPFRVVGDQPLLEAVLHRPLDQRELAAIKGFPSGLARGEGIELLHHFDRVAQLPDEELRPYPRSPRRGGPGRPAPDAEELAEKLKVARNKRAEELGLDRGTLMANALVQAVAVHRPGSIEALARVDGIRAWQVEAVGPALLEALSHRR